MAKSEEVMEITGCAVGSVPPFGHRNKIHIFVDKEIYGNVECFFNIGTLVDSVNIDTNELKKVFDSLGVVEGDFSIIKNGGGV
jgi:Ala-tRNA(Pro) deacylase